MQFKRRQINQTWENAKKPNLGPNVGSFGLQDFFHEFYLYEMLDIVASFHCMRSQGKPMTQAQENGK